MFEYVLTFIAIISLVLVLGVIVAMVVQKIRHKPIKENIRKWLISLSIIFIGTAFVGKAIGEQQSKQADHPKTLSMKVINQDGQEVKKANNQYVLKTKDKKTTFTVQTNRKAQVGYNVNKPKNGKVTDFKKVATNQYRTTVTTSNEPATIYVHAAIVGQRIGNNVIIKK